MIKAYKYRLLPSEKQKILLSSWIEACRFVYNLGLETKIAAWTSQKRNVSKFDLTKQLTELKHTEGGWLKDCPSQSLESALANLEKAYSGFFRGCGFPNFKKKGGLLSIEFRQTSKIKDGKIVLSKIGGIDFVQHRLFEGEIRTVTVSKTATGKYFVSILVKNDKELPEKKIVSESTSIGIDVGLKTLATLSDGTKIENPKYLQHQLHRLKKEQRTLARRYKPGIKISEQSKGYHEQKIVVAKLHEKIANQRKDFLQKNSTEIIKKFDTVCLEDLNVKGMMKNGNLSKAISDVGWSEFVRMLEYKAAWEGKNINKIGRFDPSSKICSTCGSINKELKLSDREWRCENCGTNHDRDENAAKNIKSFGLRAKL